MVINISKAKEIVFHSPNPNMDVDLPTLPHVEQIYEAKPVSITFSHNWHFDTRIIF